MRFSGQEYWSGLPCPAPRDLPTQESNPRLYTSPVLQAGSFPTSTAWYLGIIVEHCQVLLWEEMYMEGEKHTVESDWHS